MCGIVGLFLKDEALEPELGAMLGGMLGVMSTRGPDSAGLAVYRRAAPGRIKLTLRGPAGFDFETVMRALDRELAVPAELARHDTHAVVSLVADEIETAERVLDEDFPDIVVVGEGRSMELYKEVGRPTDVVRRFGFEVMAGSHGIGHTRMATESAVTTEGAHPFSTGADQCLVHNGSLSNHNLVRRRLARAGIRFATENDTEVAAGYLTWRLREGASLGEALKMCLADLDGFYTFVVGTRTGFGVLRDPIACKPAVMAETDGYVAFGTEYRALVDLPGIGGARVWEPEPGQVYFWERPA